MDESTKWRDSLERWMKEHYWTPYGFQRWADEQRLAKEIDWPITPPVSDTEFWHNFDRAIEGHEMRKARAAIDYDTLNLTAGDLALLKGMKIAS